MKETLISVTVAARKFSDCISRVRYQGMSFLLEKNGVPVARIIPVQQRFGSDFEHLATALRQAREPEPKSEGNAQPQSLEQVAETAPAVAPNSRKLERPPLNW